jgi:hypothetical protein
MKNFSLDADKTDKKDAILLDGISPYLAVELGRNATQPA